MLRRTFLSGGAAALIASESSAITPAVRLLMMGNSNGPTLKQLQSQAGDYHVISFARGSDTDQGVPNQGVAADDRAANRNLFVVSELNAGTAGRIDRYAMDNGYAQVPLDSCGTGGGSTIGHQGIGVEILPSNAYKIWFASRADRRNAIRADYVAGADPANQETYILFGDLASGSPATPAIDYTSTYVVSAFIDATTFLVTVRVWSLAALVAGGAGDYSASYLYQFTIPSWANASYPLQAIASDGSSIIVQCGSGVSPDPTKMRKYSMTGVLLQVSDNFTSYVNYPFVSVDGTGTPKSEPEGLCYAKINVGDAQPTLLQSVAQGDSPSKTSRIFKLGSTYTEDAANLNSKLLARFNAIGSVPTAGMQAAYQAYFNDLLTSNIWRYRGLLYWMDAETEAQSLVNLCNPGFLDLTKVGTPTFTPKAYWENNGTTGNYLTAATSLVSAPNYRRFPGCFGCYSAANGQDTGALMGTVSGTRIFLQPRNASDLCSTRMNQSTAVNTFANSAGAGLWSVARFDNTGYSVQHDGVTVSTFVEATASTSPGNLKILGSASSGSQSGRIRLAYIGLPMVDSMEATFDAINQAMFARVAALP